MGRIIVKDITPEEAKQMGAIAWSTWGCGVSEFDWSYDESETAYLLEGEADIIAEGEITTIKAGQLVFFPAGLSCVWSVKKPIRKHYKFNFPVD